MQHFKALRIFPLILGFILFIFGCEADKNQVSDLNFGIKAESVSEGIYLYFDNIPENAEYLCVSLYDITTNDNLYTGTSFQSSELEQIKKTNTLICPFVRSGHKYKIEISVCIRTEENIKTINSDITTAVANGGIHIINNPILNWNNSDNITALSERPVFSDESINSQNTELDYTLFFIHEKTSGGVGGGIDELTNVLVYDNTKNFISIIEMIDRIGLSGDIPIYASVRFSPEYNNKKWTMEIARSPEFTFSL